MRLMLRKSKSYFLITEMNDNFNKIPDSDLLLTVDKINIPNNYLGKCLVSPWPVISYKDHAVATLGKNSKGKMSVTSIELSPKVVFSRNFIIDNNKMREVQDRAHRYCFIANSLSDEVQVRIN